MIATIMIYLLKDFINIYMHQASVCTFSSKRFVYALREISQGSVSLKGYGYRQEQP